MVAGPFEKETAKDISGICPMLLLKLATCFVFPHGRPERRSILMKAWMTLGSLSKLLAAYAPYLELRRSDHTTQRLRALTPVNRAQNMLPPTGWFHISHV